MLRTYRSMGQRMAGLLGERRRRWPVILLLGALLIGLAVLQGERRGDRVRHLLERQAEQGQQQPAE